MLILRLLNLCYELTTLSIIVRAVISWIPNIDYYKEPIKTLIRFTDWILDPIKDLLDRFGLLTVIDVSPIIALFLINIVYKFLYRILIMFFIN